jgi:hypothetical protein
MLSYCRFTGFTVFVVGAAEGEARFDTDHILQLDSCFSLLGILVLRTYALYHGNKKILAFLVTLYVVRLPLLFHWIFNASRVMLGRVRYRYRDCLSFRALSEMYAIYLSGLLSNASLSL